MNYEQQRRRFQIFISSTYEDLNEVRKEILQALLAIDCIPAGMEMFPAADEAQWDLIERSIEDSDFFVIIVAQRYGSVDNSGTSYTEKEWTYASMTGKPIFAFLQKLSPEETTELEPSLVDLRRRLEANRHVKYWREALDLPGHITAAIAPAIHSHSSRAEGWVRGGYSVAEHISVLRGAVTDALSCTKRSSEDIGRIDELIQSLNDRISPLLASITSERPATVAMGHYMHVQQLKLSLAGQNSMYGRVADGLLKDPLRTLENLARGSASVPDYQIGHANNLLIGSLRHRFDAASYDDLAFWQSQSQVDARYRRAIYDAIKRAADPIIATRIFIFPANSLGDRVDAIAAVIKEQMEHGIFWAVAMEEDVKEELEQLEPGASLDFALFDVDRAVSYFRKQRKFDVTFHTGGFNDNGLEIERQVRAYRVLLANCWVASLHFASNHLCIHEEDVLASRAADRNRALEHIGIPHAGRLFPIIVEEAAQVRNGLNEALGLRLRILEST